MEEKEKTETKNISEEDIFFKYSEEKINAIRETIPEKIKIPVISDNELIVFPGMSLSIDMTNDSQITAAKIASETNGFVFAVSGKKSQKTIRSKSDFYSYGSIAKIRQIIEIAGGSGYKIILEGISRAYIDALDQSGSYLKAIVSKKDNENTDNIVLEKTHLRGILKAMENYSLVSGKIHKDIFESAKEIKSVSLLIYFLVSALSIDFDSKYMILKENDPIERAVILRKLLEEEISLLYYERTLAEKVKSEIDKGQRDYFLREQLKVIKAELGMGIQGKDESEKYLDQLNSLKLEEETRIKIEKEIRRLDFQQSGSPEISQIRNYLDLVFELPWGKTTKDNLSVTKAKKVLDKEHYGMDKVKERITEFIAVRSLKAKAGKMDIKGPILCLVGPPGVGKTSIAKSLASALNRKYIRMSLGGVRDESEIRGHRRTYIGSIPGRFITAIKQAKTDNPLILLDEVDKMSSDFRGDPSSALLEVLDPEQNNNFRDSYLEVAYDLSKVLFITTANSWENIPVALLDRMEIVNLSGYTEEEKVEIAMKHIVGKQLEENGIGRKNLVFTRAGIRKIIQGYTSEAGVRELERQISKVCRRVAIEYSTDEKSDKKISIGKNNVGKYLGRKKNADEFAFAEKLTGVANGLAWTSVGGKLLPVEVSIHEGKGILELTGQLGDVMKESAKLAYSYVKSNAKTLGLDPLFFMNKDMHIHVPAGATPKEGPSAGCALTLALISAFTGKPVDNKIALTGEITLRGKVLPVGGIKEKLIAAARFKMKKVFIPRENKGDLEDLPESVRKSLEIIPVNTLEEIIEKTFN